jgi:hypothetical protein
MKIHSRSVLLAALVAGLGLAASALAEPAQTHASSGRSGGSAAASGGHGHAGSGRGGGYAYASGGHAHGFAPRGAIVGAVPHGGVAVTYNDHHYWYHGGNWYAPHGPRWVVVGPPIGVYVPWLPGFYSTYWWGGMPYFYANDAYYVWREPRHEYEVVAPPEGAPAAMPAAEDIYTYPRNGQTEAQQGQDRYECHRWAADQTRFDPTRVGGGVSEGDAPVRRAEYFRAMGACLEGRGYSVK